MRHLHTNALTGKNRGKPNYIKVLLNKHHSSNVCAPRKCFWVYQTWEERWHKRGATYPSPKTGCRGGASARPCLRVRQSCVRGQSMYGEARTGTPHLLRIDLLELLSEVLAVRRTAVVFERLASLCAVLDALVQLLEDGNVGLLDDGRPIKSTTTSSGGARVVHVVHTVQKSALSQDEVCITTNPYWPIKG